jgi:hypothetical protein
VAQFGHTPLRRRHPEELQSSRISRAAAQLLGSSFDRLLKKSG